jgi:hypothetical protein
VDDLLLLQFVREVSILADRKRPEKVTQRAWDEAHSTLGSAEGGDPDTCDLAVSPLPSSARSIARSLRRPWREVLEIAQEPPAEWSQNLAEHSLACDLAHLRPAAVFLEGRNARAALALTRPGLVIEHVRVFAFGNLLQVARDSQQALLGIAPSGRLGFLGLRIR